MQIHIWIAKWFLTIQIRTIPYYWKYSLQYLLCPRILRTTLVYLLWVIIEGKLVIVYQINTPLWYKTTWSESESIHFGCQWTLVSFLVKHHQFYQETRLTYPLYRQTADICIGIYMYIFKRVFNVWHMLKKSVSMQQHFERFVGKQRRLEEKYFGISEAQPLGFDCVNPFSLEELCRKQCTLKYFSKQYRPSYRLEKL